MVTIEQYVGMQNRKFTKHHLYSNAQTANLKSIGIGYYGVTARRNYSVGRVSCFKKNQKAFYFPTS